MTLNSKYQWYAVYTRSRYEKKLYKLLESQNIECYLPLKVEDKQWSDRVKKIEEPLLRSYLFVKVSNKEYYKVLNTDGAVRYISFNGKAASIPEKQIEDLKLFLLHFNQNIEATVDDLERGDKVEVKSGLLKGVKGEVIEIRGKNRIVLRFRELGYCVHTEIQIKDIKTLD
ncbi:UpxY family transcription antiterminator [Sunxiuqinia sp. A32]|uniref:UpxY family transcription antiterminator n=1 Tax=Sunxiuqinia sp. A32 TaxID=3461496 RepID=UPI00404524D3